MEDAVDVLAGRATRGEPAALLALETLRTYARNAATRGSACWRVNAGNAAFQARVAGVPGGLDAFQALGWRLDVGQNAWLLSEQRAVAASADADMLDAIVASIREAAPALTAAADAATAAAAAASPAAAATAKPKTSSGVSSGAAVSERERLLAQIAADRREMAAAAVRASKANKLPSEQSDPSAGSCSRVTRFSDIGVDLSRGGG
jgi:hypothetical protein